MLSKLDAEQIERHLRSADRRGFKKVFAVAITLAVPASIPPSSAMPTAAKSFGERMRPI